MRLLYYAPGGGWGHLSRTAAVLHSLGLEAEDLLLISPSAAIQKLVPQANGLRLPEHLAQDKAGLQAFLSAEFRAFAPDLVLTDCFPGGILGELYAWADWGSWTWQHVARHIRAGSYPYLVGQSPPYQLIHACEPLEAEQEAFLKAQAELRPLLLLDPPPPPLSPALAAYRQTQRPFWLVCHAGPRAEVQTLCLWAKQLHQQAQTQADLLVLSNEDPQVPDFQFFNHYPAWPLFEPAERLITACGFNNMRQTLAYAHKHHFRPFRRRFDDQFRRAKLRLNQP